MDLVLTKLTQFFLSAASRNTSVGTKNDPLGRSVRYLSDWWFAGLQRHAKEACRDEIEAMENLRDQKWR